MHRDSPLDYLQPSNLLTYGALACALGSFLVAATLHTPQTQHLCAILLVTGALADIFDGRFARLFSRTEKGQAFGAQLDSLTDTVVFGAAPVGCVVLLLPRVSSMTLIVLGAAAFFYLICVVTRLGFYNVHAAASHDFVGVPTTVMNLLWALIFFVPFDRSWFAPFVAGAFAVAAVLMVAPIPIPRPHGKSLAVVALFALGLIAGHAALLLS